MCEIKTTENKVPDTLDVVSTTKQEEEQEGPKMPPHMTALYVFFLLFNLYFFLVGLGLMGDSFKVLGGKSAGNLFQAADHPIAGLMVGILATVLVQSSSTSTSIVVGMVGSGIMPVRQAIFIIMGANIGTSVTNTIVSLGHVKDLDEYERAFSGATVHDMFNFLCVLVLLPLEWIISAATGTGGFLYWLTHGLTSALKEAAGGKFKSPISVIVKPVYQALLKVDKDKIKALAMGQPDLDTCLTKDGSSKPLLIAKVNYYICGNQTLLDEAQADYQDKVIDGALVKGGAFKGTDDGLAGTVCLILSLILLCVCLFLLVWTLKKLFLGSAKRLVRRAANMNGYVAILVGAGVTVAVQSSSITTSALTPLVAIKVLTLEQMLPLTLGANIGTTCTALLASMVISTEAAIQIALCHFFFNVIGILLWYPIPKMRQMPLKAARAMGKTSTALRWFPLAYIITCFLLIPLILLGLSSMIGAGGVSAGFGWTLVVFLILGFLALMFFMKFKGGAQKLNVFLELKRSKNLSSSGMEAATDDKFGTNLPEGAEMGRTDTV